ncbi:hypothetical protein BV898_08808 [Hypsibius exemplaris]|uniref:Uncharacterized protein n=1 Tax=Hypsibius exemplaris TaxID=2072580 RepID=A0A1W0WPH4_HYPEX|nr:hypothetical protein BV898_08808 [Hypsibius exemplaris]
MPLSGVGVYALAFICPPLSVYLSSSNNDTQERDILTSVVLTLMGFLPGIVHALVLANRQKNDEDEARDHGRPMKIAPLSDVGVVVTAFIFPPLSVFLTASTNEHLRRDMLISVSLTLMGYLPGIIHALVLAYRKHSDPNGARDVKRTVKMIKERLSRLRPVVFVKALHRNMLAMSFREIGAIIFAFLLPPLSVLLVLWPQIGSFSSLYDYRDLIINVVLTLMGFLPGIPHALWTVYQHHLARFSWS